MSNLKTVSVQFTESKYNYHTSVNGNLSDFEIISYFENKVFNMGGIKYIKGEETEIDDLQKCVKCTIIQ